MRYLSVGTLIAAFALTSFAVGRANPPAGAADDSAEFPVAQSMQRQRTQRPLRQKANQAKRHHQYHGHKFLSPARLRQLRHGTHHISNLHGHRLHAVLNRGKIARLFMTNSRGKTIHPRRHHKAGRLALADFGNPAPVYDVAQGVLGGGMVCFTFSLQGPTGPVTVTICFPMSMMFGGGGMQPLPDPVPDPVPDPNPDPDPDPDPAEVSQAGFQVGSGPCGL